MFLQVNPAITAFQRAFNMHCIFFYAKAAM